MTLTSLREHRLTGPGDERIRYYSDLCSIKPGKLTSSTHSWRSRSWSSKERFRALTMSSLKTMSMMGFSGALVQTTQSLRGSSCAFMVLMFSRQWAITSGFDCSMFRVSLAVTASIAGSAAEKVKEADEMRWCSTTSLAPAQNPPPAQSGPAREPMIMSTCEGSTFCASVRPRPVRPRTPNDQVSSKMMRNLYFSFSST